MTLRGFFAREVLWTSAALALVAALADGVSVALAADLGSGDAARVLASSAAWAAVVGAGAAAAAAFCGWLASLFFRPPAARRRAGAVGASVPVAVALLLGGLDLLSGPGISGRSWVGAARIAWVVAAAAGPPVLALIALAAVHPPGGGGPRRLVRRAFAAAAPAMVAGALWLDHEVHPKLYPVGHLMLWLGIFAVAALASSAPALSGRPARGAWLLLALLVGAAAAAIAADPLADAPVARAAAYRETLFLKRALTHLKPPVAAVPLAPDPDVVRALKTATALDAALLDQAFPGRRRMNVIVISVDALRPDRLGSRGYPRNVTPNLDALVASGTDFTRAWTTYPFTLMAFGSVFRGVYASGSDAWRYRDEGHPSLPWEPQPSLAALLGARGFRTEAVVGFPRFVRETLAREEGFQHFNAHADPRARDRSLVAEEVTDLAIDALDRDPGRPFLLWVHYFDPHAPYAPPGGSPFGDEPADLYDAEILYADRGIGRLLAALRERDLTGNTAIAVFGDHGEDLVERDHGTALTEINVHVPFVLALPRTTPRRVDVAVDLTDLAPTLLDLLDVTKPAHLHGQSLLPCILLGGDARGGAGFPPDLAFTEMGGAGLPQARQFAARAGDLKIICHAGSQTYSLFDLAADPSELRDVSRERPDALARMKRVLDSFLALIAETPRGAPRDSRK